MGKGPGVPGVWFEDAKKEISKTQLKNLQRNPTTMSERNRKRNLRAAEHQVINNFKNLHCRLKLNKVYN